MIIEINKIISIGSICFSSQWIKDNNYKRESYPFDWIVSSLDMCLHCINDDFNLFLEKKHHYQIKTKRPVRTGHLIYDKFVNTNIFRHHNIINKHEYYCRCVDRFIKLYKNSDYKLFVHFRQYNDTEISNEDLQKLKLFNDTLKLKINNFYILYIHSYKQFGTQKHHIQEIDNMIILNIWTNSPSNGRKFEDDIDNKYLNKIIHELFNFIIKENT